MQVLLSGAWYLRLLYSGKDLQNRILPWSVLLLLWSYLFQPQFVMDLPANQTRGYPCQEARHFRRTRSRTCIIITFLNVVLLNDITIVFQGEGKVQQVKV